MSSTKRSAFTLVEILVVIAIIAILVSLLMGGVMVFMSKGPELQNRTDILQISVALDQFYAEKHFFPPDRIRLCSNSTQYNPGGSELDKISLAYIAAMWPSLGSFTGIQWAGSAAMPAGGHVLEGDQCLVFFLGGPPSGGATPSLLGGFSINPKDPVYLPPYNPATRPQLDRKKYFDFAANRLVFRTSSNPSTAVFPSYLDANAPNLDASSKKPLVYFSSYKRPDGYSPINWWVGTPNTLGVKPYLQTAAAGGQAAKYWESTRFQLISAGPNGLFGPGGTVWPGVLPKEATDDTANFHERKLGSP